MRHLLRSKREKFARMRVMEALYELGGTETYSRCLPFVYDFAL